ncbi:hypothetical protein [Altererythrobacter sp. ZODW24]|uniref:hypothetical protein n=1 Tax=Altererythrobacter sp. ZODW24 TaxID=2185142 RepID=UPI000DF7B386|nr:hypothetical protein [Altererythrobacter sp. ZODW24]
MKHSILALVAITLGSALLLAGCSTGSAQATKLAATPAEKSSHAPSNLPCGAGELTIFSGQVEDDFGFDYQICVIPSAQADTSTITIRWQGEGGGSSVSCIAKKCDGVINLVHYVRPRMTLLTLRWAHGGKVQRMDESFDATDRNAEPAHLISHTMFAEGIDAAKIPIGYRVKSKQAPLALLELGRYLPVRSWGD